MTANLMPHPFRLTRAQAVTCDQDQNYTAEQKASAMSVGTAKHRDGLLRRQHRDGWALRGHETRAACGPTCHRPA